MYTSYIQFLLKLVVVTLFAFTHQLSLAAATSISDQPIFVTNSVPPNMMLVLSVEWPTGVVGAYKAGYTETNRYLGYFEPERCYKYYTGSGSTLYNTPDSPSTVVGSGRDATSAATEYFKPSGTTTDSSNHRCSGDAFSGNYLNWATMHGIDEFRFAMTGGDRVIDTATITVVEKTRHSGQGGTGQFPRKDISTSTNVNQVSPFSGTNWANMYGRVSNNTTELNPFDDNATRGRVIQISNNTGFSNSGSTGSIPNITYTYLVRVQLCNLSAPGGLEYNGAGDYKTCLQYPSGNYKPVGLIQKNANKMRFGAMGYLMDSSGARAGGVLRARMKSVGPEIIIAGGSPVTNPNSEWDANTGVFVANPDTADATASGVTNSGVINYLNKFGKVVIQNYKGNDPYSELYYAAQRALRNLSPVPEYISGLTAGMYDGFPVITSTVDESSNDQDHINARPVQYSCQQHNFVGIGDSNCHTDVFVPGNTLVGYAGHPTTGLTDGTINIQSLENTIGSLQTNGTVTNLSTMYANNGRKNTFHVAGLAYWANTQDMLPDVTTKPWTQGKQTAKSYFVDVREAGSSEPPPATDSGWNTSRNQFWLAAKYGGFSDLNNNGVPANNATWDENNNQIPDNYFTADSPDKLIAALNDIFNNALSRSLAGSGATLSAINYQAATTSSAAFTVQYNSGTWTGDVLGNQFDMNALGEITINNMWSAKVNLDSQATGTGWDTGRKIVTYNAVGVPFRLDSLSATQKGYLGASTVDQQKLLDYTRGKKTDEGTLYRPRVNLLGDIINSEAAVVGKSNEPYTDTTNLGYSAYKSTKSNRKRIVYVAANDGMLHAIDGDVGTAACSHTAANSSCPTADIAAVAPGTTAGKELFAYIPSFVIAGATNPTTDGLQSRAAVTGFQHKYLVDQTPMIRDVDFNKVRGATGMPTLSSPTTTPATAEWHTILVGGLGKGGRGYYAIDISDPTSWTTESAVAGKVLWEFTDQDMGYSYARPLIVKTQRDGWVVIVASGYNNTLGSTAANRGKGYLYILNAKTGALIEKISTTAGDATTPSGFAHPVAFIPAMSDFITDYVYGGDLLGNVWRFNLTGFPTSYPTPVKIASLTDPINSNPQPITIEPKVEIGNYGNARWVFIGTGKLFANSDLADNQKQSFYAIRDGNIDNVFYNGTSGGSTTDCAPLAMPTRPNLEKLELSQPCIKTGSQFTHLTFPVTRTKMKEVTSLITGFSQQVANSDGKPMGWFYDLANTVNTSQKITSPLVANEGVISWNAYTPTTDPCAPGASSDIFAADFDTGISRFVQNGAVVEKFSESTYLVKLQFVKDEAGKIRAVATSGNPDQQITTKGGTLGQTKYKGIKVNWREVFN